MYYYIAHTPLSMIFVFFDNLKSIHFLMKDEFAIVIVKIKYYIYYLFY